MAGLILFPRMADAGGAFLLKLVFCIQNTRLLHSIHLKIIIKGFLKYFSAVHGLFRFLADRIEKAFFQHGAASSQEASGHRISSVRQSWQPASFKARLHPQKNAGDPRSPANPHIAQRIWNLGASWLSSLDDRPRIHSHSYGSRGIVQDATPACS